MIEHGKLARLTPDASSPAGISRIAGLRLLLAVPEGTDVASIRRALRAQECRARTEIVHRLSDAEARVATMAFDLALVDFGLVRGGGRATGRMGAMLATIPVVLLVGASDEAGAMDAIRYGVQDYLVREQITPHHLARTLRCAIERARHLRDLSLVDPLTGLYNRRGFELLAEAQLKWLRRNRSSFVILYADVDGLKGINDGLGHAAGDHAIITVARTLRSCMRESDVVARVGGDEFAAIARDATHGHLDALIGRVRGALRAAPAGRGGDRPLSVSIGAVHYGGHGELSLSDLMARADQALYRDKRRRSAGLVARPAVSTL